MMGELLQDIRTEFRESPGIAAMIVIAIAIGVGFNAAIFWEADGDELRMTASRVEPIEDQLSRLRSHSCSEDAKPGVTIVVGLRQYSLELSVPVPRVRSLFANERPDTENARARKLRNRQASDLRTA